MSLAASCRPAYALCRGSGNALNRSRDGIRDKAEKTAIVLARRPCRQYHADETPLGIGPCDGASGAAVAKRAWRGEIAKIAPDRRGSQTPTESPRLSDRSVLIADHC